MSYKAVLEDGRGRFEKTLVHLKDQLKRIRTGRASTALVDNIRVDYYGTMTPVNQMASVSIPEPRQILIKPFDASVLKELSKAILQSDLGTTPNITPPSSRNIPPLIESSCQLPRCIESLGRWIMAIRRAESFPRASAVDAPAG